VYRIIPDTTVSDQITALPTEALPHLAEVLTTLELTPWNGRPHHEDNPTGAVRRWTFGPHHAGHIIYLAGFTAGFARAASREVRRSAPLCLRTLGAQAATRDRDLRRV
jgi:hypothetical protein